MKRRDFLELSASATAAVMLGNFVDIKKSLAANDDMNRGLNGNRFIKMRGGCRDFRVMNDSVPDFFEREIIDSWA